MKSIYLIVHLFSCHIKQMDELFVTWKNNASHNFTEVIESHDILSNNTILFLNILNDNDTTLEYKVYQHVRNNKEIQCDRDINNDYVKKILNNEINNIGNIIVFFNNNNCDYQIPNELVDFVNGYEYILINFKPYGFLFLNAPAPSNNYIWYCQEWFPFYKGSCYILVNVNKKSQNYSKYVVVDNNFNKMCAIFTDFEDIKKIIYDDAIINFLPPTPKEESDIIKIQNYSIVQHIRRIPHNTPNLPIDTINHLEEKVLCTITFYPRDIVLYLALVSNYETYISYKKNNKLDTKITYSIRASSDNNIKHLNNNGIKYDLSSVQKMSQCKDYEFCYDDVKFLMETDLSKKQFWVWDHWAKTHEKIKVHIKTFFEKYYSQMINDNLELLDDYLFDHENLVEEIKTKFTVV